MYAPHPSYPPLDLAVSGAVAVSTQDGSKTSLEQYSDNIICAQPDLSSLEEGLRRGAELAADDEVRRANYERSRFERSWTRR